MIDRLIEKADILKNPTVVGLDPTYEIIPNHIKKDFIDSFGTTPYAVSKMFFEFNKGIIDAVCETVPAIKPQIAMYEKYGLEGLGAYMKTVEYAKKQGLIVIGDIKRGDIASTAENYAAHIGGVDIEGMHFDQWNEDAVTLNPYLGSDGIIPFIDICEEKDRAIFILVRTSNESSAEIQEDIYNKVGRLVSKWGESTIGKYSYSKVGAVVGATRKEEGAELRKLMPHTFFLVPGYGAQGAGADDIADFFDKDGRGAIVNSSRGIIAAWKRDGKYSDENYADAAYDAVVNMKADLQRVLY